MLFIGGRHTDFCSVTPQPQAWEVICIGAPEPVLREAINDAFAALRRVDELMSVFSATSDIGKLNLAAGKNEIEADDFDGRIWEDEIFF